MNHHNQLDKFASRGLKAQAAVDSALKLEDRSLKLGENLPAVLPPAGVVQVGPGVGRRETAAPRSAGMLVRILSSTDTAWLKMVMNSQDYTIGMRSAAQRRLGKLFRKGKQK